MSRIWLATCMIAALAVDAPAAPQAPRTIQGQKIATTLNLQGCLHRAKGSHGGADGSAYLPPPAPFLLTEASSHPRIAPDFYLDSPEQDLAPFLGRSVEITGPVVSPPHGFDRPPFSERNYGAPLANAPTVRVATIKVAAAACR
jgi:hypothetical protein